MFLSQVHQAILLPLCPLLESAVLDVAPEEPVILLPEVSMEIVMAFLHVIYEGYVFLSSFSVASEVNAVQNLMASFGLHIPNCSWTLEGPCGSLLQVDQGEPQSELQPHTPNPEIQSLRRTIKTLNAEIEELRQLKITLECSVSFLKHKIFLK